MAELTARPDSWLDYLPGNWQQAVNTNPLLNALGRALQRPAPDLTRGIEHDQYGSVSDRNWLLQQAAGGPPKLNPLAADMLDKGGLLANFLAPGVRLPAAAPKPTGIRAYHGSPHDFDKFDISKIGTGEGAQAYGRGLYFAESEGVAKSYRESLAGHGYDLSGATQAARVTMMSGRSIDGAIALAKRRGETWIVEELEAIKAKGRDPKGRMYEVRINADPEQFLDWDKPISGQSEPVRRAIEAYGFDPAKTIGQTMHEEMPFSDLRSPQLADQLKRDGIPGIKYLDQQSRAAGQGSRNYVVFDDQLVTILRKYGLLPPVAAGVGAINEVSDDARAP